MKINMLAKTILSVGLTAVMGGQLGSAAEGPPSRSEKDEFADFEKLTFPQRDKLAWESIEQLRRTEASLLRKLSSATEEEKPYIVSLLGHYRFPGAVNPLAKDIAYAPSWIPQSGGGFKALWGLYPAAHSLVLIGSPSIPAMISNLESSDQQQVTKLSLWVVVRIDKDVELTRFRLERALELQKDEKKRTRLRSALHALAEKTYEW